MTDPRASWRGRGRLFAGNALLFAALFLLVTFNKEYLRPALWNVPVAGTLTGCLPNFLAAMLISLAFVNAVLSRRLRRGRLLVYISSVVVFLVLTVEEIKPMWGASTVFDSFDVIASAAGSTAAILVYEIASSRRKPVKA
jgi:hypothetical protein